MFNKLYYHFSLVRSVVNFCKYKNIRIHNSTRIETLPGAQLNLGQQVTLCQRVHLFPNQMGVTIQDQTSIQDDCRIYGNVSIGTNCLFAPNVFISSANHTYNAEPCTPINYQEKKYDSTNNKVTIGDDCWIGINCYIAPGVQIGSGCVVGANSSVTKDLPPYSIAVGSPAKVIKNRIEFNPLSQITTTDKNHWPYFYIGFIKNDDSVTSLKEFTLALKTSIASSAIELNIIATTSGYLEYQNQTLKYEIGANQLIYKNKNSEDNFYFNFKSTEYLHHVSAKLK